jgi:hypothetical protein
VSIVLPQEPQSLLPAGIRSGPDAPPPDEDDGIHVACVTRVERPDGPVLRIVVGWMEDGGWVYRGVEMPEGPQAGAQDGPRGADRSGLT